MIAARHAAGAGGDARLALADGRRGRLRRARHVVHRSASIIKPFNVVLDAGSGMAGLVAPLLFARLPCQDDAACASRSTARFPITRPIRSSRRTGATSSSASIATKADIGIAWDGDADRCFFIDGTGEFIAGDFVTALLAEAFLLRHPGAKVVYDVRASYAVKDTVGRSTAAPRS